MSVDMEKMDWEWKMVNRVILREWRVKHADTGKVGRR